MNKKNPLRVSERRQLKLCLLSCSVVWSLSSVLVFQGVEETYRIPLIFGFVSFVEALFLVPILMAFYLVNQKPSFQRQGINGVIRRILLGGALGMVAGSLLVFFNFRDGDFVRGLVFAGAQGVAISVLYPIFQSTGLFKGQAEGQNTHKSLRG